jgi:uridylate kinase
MGTDHKYKRIMVKLSGEALAGDGKMGFDTSIVGKLAQEIKAAREMDIEVALVIGGGNFFRGSFGETLGIERATGDYMGMLATVMNALAMQDSLEKIGVPTRVMSAIEMRAIAEPYIRRRAIRHLQILMKATKVDGVYDKDPAKHGDAVRIEKIPYIDVIQKQLRVMDLTAISLCMDNKLPIVVFNLFADDSILRVARGEDVGTTIF